MNRQIYRISISAFLFNYIWMFFLYLTLFLFASIAFVGTQAILLDSFLENQTMKHTMGNILILEIVILSLGFIVWFIWFIQKNLRQYSGTIIKKYHVEEEGEIGTVTWYYIELKTSDKTHTFRLEANLWEQLDVGMVISMKYDHSITGPRSVYGN